MSFASETESFRQLQRLLGEHTVQLIDTYDPIEGARRAGADSLLVLTGVTDPAALLAALPLCRPDFLLIEQDFTPCCKSGGGRPNPSLGGRGTGWPTSSGRLR